MPSVRIPSALRRSLNLDGTEPSARQGHADGRLSAAYTDPRVQAFVQVNTDAVYDWNVRSGTIYFSDRLDAMLGMEPGSFPRTFEGFLAHLHPHDHDDFCAAIWESTSTGQEFVSEYRLRRADGTYVTVLDQGVVLLDKAKRVTNMIGAIRDVTQDREAARARREAGELRKVLFRIGKPAMQIDGSGRYMDATDEALAFFERTPEDMLAAGVSDDFPPDVVKLLTDPRALEADGVEVEVDCKVGRSRKTLSITAIPCHVGDEVGCFVLGTDITERKEFERQLARSERALRHQATILDERNAALKVLLEQRQQDRAELEERLASNVRNLIEPTLDRLSKSLTHRPERQDVEALRVNLLEIVGPFATSLTGAGGPDPPLTRRELEVANLVRLGRTSAEIASLLHISHAAVSFHRANIRRKLGLPKRGLRLSTHLSSLADGG